MSALVAVDRRPAVEALLPRLDLAGLLAALPGLTGDNEAVVVYAEIVRVGVIAEVLDLAVQVAARTDDGAAVDAAVRPFADRMAWLLGAPTEAAW